MKTINLFSNQHQNNMRKTFTFPGRIASALFAVLLFVSGSFFAQTFSSSDVMTVLTTPANQPASIYPSSITVSGGPSAITGMSVTLNSVTHTWPDDFEVVLVAPNGNNLVLMSDCGGSTDISAVSITFSDVAAESLNSAGGIVSGTYFPTDYPDGIDPAMPAPFSGTLASPAPTGSATLGGQFVGSDANGTWSLYVRDEFAFDGGNISGWSITFEQAVVGCTDPEACNFDPLAAANDGSCVYPGCTNDAACNFDPNAGCEDGSCCFGECVSLVITGGSFPGEIGWQFLDPNGVVIDFGDFGGVATGGILHAEFYCLDAPACDYSIVMTDEFGDGWNGGQYFFVDAFGDVIAQGALVQLEEQVPPSQTDVFAIGLTFGCTDPLATNFNPEAGCDDGSCVACAPGEQTVSVLMGDFGDDGWQGGAYSIANSNGDVLFTGSLDGAAIGDGVSFGQDVVCLADGCYTITISGSAAPEDIAFQVLDAANNLVIQGFSPIVGDGVAYGFALGEDQGCEFDGCTNADCFNYNPFATTDDGSCICPPANDDCANAIPLDCGTTVEGSLAFADVEPALPTCALSVSTGGVWYSFVGTGGDVTVSTCGTEWDTKLHIYSGDCVVLACEANDDDNCDAPTGLASSATFTTVENETYYALVTRFSTSTVGTDFVISLECPTNTIWDIVQNSEIHNTLEAAINAANLGDALSGPGPLTLFAPTDDAFAALPPGVVDALLADPSGALTDVLLYHVVEGAALSTSLSDGQTITTLLGEDITVTINVDGVFINDAQVIVADIEADNGVVHVIDAVLIPPAAPVTTVVDIIAGSVVHNTLEAAITAAGLIEVLEGDGPFTVFAPTDDAFAALPAGVLDALLADPTGQLTDILLYHVVAGQALAADLSDGQTITTVLGEDVTVTINVDGVFINDAEVIVTDLLADNGVVHVIDAVLLPPAPITVMDIIANSDVHTTLELAIGLAGLTETLQGAGPFTVFAPTDDAFAALPAGVLDALVADPTGQLTDILLYHVVAGQALSTDLSDGQTITTVFGEDVTVTINVDGVFINDAQVIVADLLADNGVVHVIDAVLLPPAPITVMDIIANSDVHTTLELAIGLAGLTETLQGAGPFTVFAPTDDAFAALPAGVLDALVADPTGGLTNVLLYHVVAGQALSTDLSDGQSITTVLGQDVVVTINPNGVFINDAQVIVADLLADNGVVHVIDAVLVPVAVEVAVEASSTEVCEGNAIAFISETTSTLAAIVSEQWTVTGPEDFDAVGGVAEFTFETPGEYEVTFTATDGLGFSASASVVVTITAAPILFADTDGDGFGDDNNTLASCVPVDGFVGQGGDCDDDDSTVFPGAEEVCDEVDNDCDGDTDEGVQTTFFADNDADGFGDESNSITACSAPIGFVTNDGDCNDDNAAIRPGANEACDGVDNDCDGDTDEGCFGPAPNNDEIGGATPINATAYNVTQPLYGNLFNATPSEEYVDDDAFEGAGQDSWYQFQSTSEAVRIRVYSAVCNVAIQLQDGEGNVVAEEDANAGIGTEILNVDGLTPNETYFVAVRNLVNVGGPYVINVRRYDPSFLTTTTAQTLCGNARSQFTNANAYTFQFEGQTSGITYTRTINSSTIALLSGVTGLEAGQTYNTTVNATFLPTNSVGTVETMNVEGVTTLPFVVSPSAAMSLRAIDVCPSVKTLASSILATPFNCGAVDFQWEFTRTAPSASLPVVFLKGNSSRFLQLAAVPGIESGATYNVRVRPRFANGSFGQWGAVSCVSTVGPVTLDAVSSDVLAPETETGIEEAGIASSMIVFPNPTSGNEVQLMSDVQLSDCNVTINDLTGRRVAQWNGYELNAGVSSFRPTGTLTSGVYMLRIESAQGAASYRFIVQ
jgi:uncharacterized surface protein with fasciclin (FAS1) repeats/subtilisin-like proprotein convertase family protein